MATWQGLPLFFDHDITPGAAMWMEYIDSEEGAYYQAHRSQALRTITVDGFTRFACINVPVFASSRKED